MKKLLFVTLIALAASSAAFAQSESDELKAKMAVKEGEPAPGFTLKNTEGVDVSLSDFRGQWVLLDCWGTWCKYCMEDMPSMKEAYELYHPLGLEIIGIDSNDKEEIWINTVNRLELPWVNVTNPDRRKEGVCGAYGIQGFPTKVLIDPEGNINLIYVGEDPEFYGLLKERLQP